MLYLEIVAVGLGLASGALAAWIFNAASSRLGDDGFWTQFRSVIQLLISGDEDHQFLEQYLRLLPLFCKHLGKKLAVLMLAFLPVILVIVAFTPLANRVWYENATRIEFFPPQTLSVHLDEAAFQLDLATTSIPIPQDIRGPARLVSSNGEFRIDTLMCKHAYSPTMIEQMLLTSIGFKTMPMAKSAGDDSQQKLMLQPTHNDNNFLWPYLNDWEFDVLVAVSIGSISGLVIGKRRGR